MWLIVDDERTLGCDVIARNAHAARAVLGGLGYAFEGLCLDHDLGPGESGYDVLMWAIEADVLPPKVQLVTMNPVGRKNMMQALIAAGYKPDADAQFRFCCSTQPKPADAGKEHNGSE